MGPFSIECIRCSKDSGGGVGGVEVEAAGRVWDGMPRKVCKGFPLVYNKCHF